MYCISRSTNPEGAAPGFLVWRLSMKWRVAVDRAVAPLGLTHAQYSLVASLYGMHRTGLRPSQRQLADHTGLEPLYVSKLARALEAAGLIERTRDPADPRAVQLTLTDQGREVTRRAIGIVNGLLEQLLTPLGGLDGPRTKAFSRELATLLDVPLDPPTKTRGAAMTTTAPTTTSRRQPRHRPGPLRRARGPGARPDPLRHHLPAVGDPAAGRGRRTAPSSAKARRADRRRPQGRRADVHDTVDEADRQAAGGGPRVRRCWLTEAGRDLYDRGERRDREDRRPDLRRTSPRPTWRPRDGYSPWSPSGRTRNCPRVSRRHPSIAASRGIFDDSRGSARRRRSEVDMTYYDHGTPRSAGSAPGCSSTPRTTPPRRASSTAWSRRCRSRPGPRLLLARAYYHSAQLGRAETQLRVLVERDPVEHYARLMLGRTLQRQGRDDEAEPHLRLASALAGDFESCELLGEREHIAALAAAGRARPRARSRARGRVARPLSDGAHTCTLARAYVRLPRGGRSRPARRPRR